MALLRVAVVCAIKLLFLVELRVTTGAVDDEALFWTPHLGAPFWSTKHCALGAGKICLSGQITSPELQVLTAAEVMAFAENITSFSARASAGRASLTCWAATFDATHSHAVVAVQRQVSPPRDARNKNKSETHSEGQQSPASQHLNPASQQSPELQQSPPEKSAGRKLVPRKHRCTNAKMNPPASGRTAHLLDSKGPAWNKGCSQCRGKLPRSNCSRLWRRSERVSRRRPGLAGYPGMLGALA